MRWISLSFILLCTIAVPLSLYCGKPLRLPSEPLSDADWPSVQRTIGEALRRFSHETFVDKSQELAKGQRYRRADKPGQGLLIMRLAGFADWLESQGCVDAAHLPFHSAEGIYSTGMLLSYPAQIPIGVRFRVRDKGLQNYRLFVRVERGHALSFIGLERSDLVE